MADKEKARRGANDMRQYLPPGSTAFAWKGELYAPGSTDPRSNQDPDKWYSSEGAETELPEDFPSGEDLQANLERGQRRMQKLTPESQPVQQVVTPGASGSGTSLGDAEASGWTAGQQHQRAGGSKSTGGDGQDFDGMTKDDLEEYARRNDLTVERSDGEEGAPLKEDYLKAARKHAKQQAK
jgi:hypothetical protein